MIPLWANDSGPPARFTIYIPPVAGDIRYRRNDFRFCAMSYCFSVSVIRPREIKYIRLALLFSFFFFVVAQTKMYTIFLLITSLRYNLPNIYIYMYNVIMDDGGTRSFYLIRLQLRQTAGYTTLQYP